MNFSSLHAKKLLFSVILLLPAVAFDAAGQDLLALVGQTEFVIETPEAYRIRMEGGKRAR